MRGKWISIDGCSGSGKTTFVNKLKKMYPEFVFIPEFSDSVVGNTLSNAVKIQPYLISNSVIGASLLFLSDYFQMLETIIIPSVNEGKYVISDRGFLSKIAVQSAVMSELYNTEQVRKALIELFQLSMHPDYSIIMDTPMSEIKNRLVRRDGYYNAESERFNIETIKEIDYYSKFFNSNIITITNDIESDKLISKIKQYCN